VPPNLEPATMEVKNPVTDEPPNEDVLMLEAEVLKLTIAQLEDELKKHSGQLSNHSKKEKLRECLSYPLSAELPLLFVFGQKMTKDKLKKKQAKEKAEGLLEFAHHIGCLWQLSL
jgi:hypothetical protein